MNLILKQLMKNSLIVVFLSSCFLYSSGNEDIVIKDFFKNLYNKTVILEINNNLLAIMQTYQSILIKFLLIQLCLMAQFLFSKTA